MDRCPRLEKLALTLVMLCGTAIVLLGPAASYAQDKPRVAILDLITRESKDDADAVTEEIRTAFVKSGRYQVVDRTLTAKILDEWATQQSGLTETDKAQRIGKLYTVKSIVTGKISHVGDGWQISVAMLDTESGVTTGAETVRYEGKFFALLNDRVPTMARALATQSGQGTPPQAEVAVASAAQPANPGASGNPPTASPTLPATATAVARPNRPDGSIRVGLFPPLLQGGMVGSAADKLEFGDANLASEIRKELDTAKIVEHVAPGDPRLKEPLWVGFFKNANQTYVLKLAKEMDLDLALLYKADFAPTGVHSYAVIVYDPTTGKEYSDSGTFSTSSGTVEIKSKWNAGMRASVDKIIASYRKDHPELAGSKTQTQ